MSETWIKNINKSSVTYTLKAHYGRKTNGSYRWKKFTAPTKREAREKRDKYELREGYANSSLIAKTSLYEYLKSWGELYYKNTVKEQTYVGFLNALESRIKPYAISSVQMINLNVDMLQNYIRELNEAKYARDTICKTWRYIKNCLQCGIDKGDIGRIPLRLVKTPTEDNVLTKKKEIYAFEAEDIEKIKKEASKTLSTGNPKYFYGNAIMLLMNTGLRIGELLGLTWENVNFDEGIIHINKSAEFFQDKSEFATKKTKEVIGPTKTAKSNRYVVINKTARELLEKIKETNKGHTGNKDRVILSTKFTTPSRRNIGRCLEKITKNACTQITTCGVHRLRHTYATNFLDSGMSLAFISNQLGHAKESTTQNIYKTYRKGTFNEDKKIFEQF